MPPLHNPACFASHMGLWAVDATFMRGALAAVQSGAWKMRAETPAAPEGPGYYMAAPGIAEILISGAMMKGRSKFGGTSTVDARRAVRLAAADKAVDGIMIHIDSSPGGTVAGTDELATDIRAAMRRKPVEAHIDDMGASAALWVASQAGYLSANRTAEVGSIGVFAVVVDESQALEAEGVKVHVISTGPHKGAGVAGAPVTDDHLAEFQKRVDQVNQHFQAALKLGRPGVNLSEVSDGRVFSAADAKGLGLIDNVSSYEAAIRHLESSIASRNATPARDRAAARLALSTL